VELDLIDAMPESVVGAQDGRVPVGHGAETERLPANNLTEPAQAGKAPGSRVPLDGFLEDRVLIEEVVPLEWWRLVEDLVRISGAIRSAHHRTVTPQNTVEQ
jgi:hypothetical protein